MKEVILGHEYKDRVTGFKGIAVAKTTHLNGCDRIAIQAKKGKDGNIEEAQVFDEPDLIFVSKGIFKTTKEEKDKIISGGPHKHKFEAR